MEAEAEGGQSPRGGLGDEPAGIGLAGNGAPVKVPLWKRALDIGCIFLALPGVGLLMLGIAALIKLVSPGPVFFKQQRIGLGGRRFLLYKFRTMRVGADAGVHETHLRQLIRSDAPMTKMDANGDPRIIPCGSWLRASGLDELPQLINVVKGDMSLVGPRPCTPYEFEDYLPWHKQRFQTLPGLTGLWQVSGKNKTTFTEMVNLDIYYARNQSLWLDLKIMAATFSALATQVREMRQAHHRPAPGALLGQRAKRVH